VKERLATFFFSSLDKYYRGGFQTRPCTILKRWGNKVIEKASLSPSSKSVLNLRYNLRSELGKKAYEITKYGGYCISYWYRSVSYNVSLTVCPMVSQLSEQLNAINNSPC
jgi:hypothetical protein